MRQLFLPFAAILAAALVSSCGGQGSQAPTQECGGSEFTTEYLTPTRVVLTKGPVNGPEILMRQYPGQVSTSEPLVTVFSKGGSVLLDFVWMHSRKSSLKEGKELNLHCDQKQYPP